MILKKEALFITIIVLISAILTILLFQFRISPFHEFSLKTEDSLYAFNKNNPAKNITTILIDEKSVNRFGRWPWNRKIIAKGIEKLKPAKVVVLDMIFSEPTEKEPDRILSQTILSVGNIVCGFFLRPKATETQTEEALDILSDSALLKVPKKLPIGYFPHAEINIQSILKSCLLSGTLNAIGDSDQIIRHYHPVLIFNGEVYPSLGVQALRIFLNTDATITKNSVLTLKNRKIPIKKDGILLNFYQPEKYNINTFSFIDLYDNKIPLSKIKNKIVLLGVSEAGVTDIKPTPIGYLPGPFIHLTFISNFLNNDFVFHSFYTDIFLSILFLIPLITIFFKAENIYSRIAFYFSFLCLLILTLILLYLKKVFFPSIFYIVLFLSFFILFVEIYSIAKKTKESRFMKNMFGTYVSKEILNIMIKNPKKLKLGGEKKNITVLFIDIRNFTSLSEKMKPEKLVEVINFIFTPLTEIILKNKGTLDKYIGDAIMAVWNAPLTVDNHPLKAVTSASDILKIMKYLNRELKKKGISKIQIGIGINTGVAVVGNMGSKIRFDYTAIGDTVNLASRLEGLNKIYGTNVLVSQFTLENIKNHSIPVTFIEIDSVKVKGKEKPVRIFTFLEKNSTSMKIKETYEKALLLYRKGRFREAANIFRKVCNFPPAKLMLYRCKELIKENPEKWDGVFTHKTK